MSALGDISARQESRSKDSTFESGIPNFRFERDRVQQLRLQPSPHLDLSDEQVEQLKVDIIRQGKEAKELCERNSTRLLAVGIVALCFAAIKALVGVVVLLMFWMQELLGDQLLFWVGSLMLLCAGGIFIPIKAIGVARDHSLAVMQDFLCCSAFCFGLFASATVMLLLLITVLPIPCSRLLTPEQTAKLILLQGALIANTILKLIIQTVCLVLCILLRSKLQLLEALTPFEAQAP